MKSLKWEVNFDNKKIAIARVKNDFLEDIFVDKAWGRAIYEQNYNEKGEFAFYYASNADISISETGATYVVIDQKPFQNIKICVDDIEIAMKNIKLFQFFASTDTGTLLVSFCPFLEKVARPLILDFEAKGRRHPYIYHLSALWLNEIISEQV